MHASGVTTCSIAANVSIGESVRLLHSGQTARLYWNYRMLLDKDSNKLNKLKAVSVHLTKDYGRLKKDTAYVRRDSSTDVASG